MPNPYAAEAIEPIGSVSSPKKLKELLSYVESIPLPVLQPILSQAADILKPSTQISASPLSSDRPKLIPPDAAIYRYLSEYRYLKEMDLMKNRSNKITESMAKRLEIFKRHIVKLNEENIKKIQENIDKASTNHFWAMLTKAATALMAALSFALGIALIAGGGSALAGGALIISGVLSIANFVCTEANVWNELAKSLARDDEERRKKIGMALPIALGIISTGIGLFGGIHNIAQTTNFLTRNVMSIVQSAITGFQGVVTVGQAFSQGSLIRSQGELTGIKDGLSQQQVYLQIVSTWIENFMAELKGINQKASQVASMIIQSNQKLVEA